MPPGCRVSPPCNASASALLQQPTTLLVQLPPSAAFASGAMVLIFGADASVLPPTAKRLPQVWSWCTDVSSCTTLSSSVAQTHVALMAGDDGEPRYRLRTGFWRPLPSPFETPLLPSRKPMREGSLRQGEWILPGACVLYTNSSQAVLARVWRGSLLWRVPWPGVFDEFSMRASGDISYSELAVSGLECEAHTGRTQFESIFEPNVPTAVLSLGIVCTKRSRPQHLHAS